MLPSANVQACNERQQLETDSVRPCPRRGREKPVDGRRQKSYPRRSATREQNGDKISRLYGEPECRSAGQRRTFRTSGRTRCADDRRFTVMRPGTWSDESRSETHRTVRVVGESRRRDGYARSDRAVVCFAAKARFKESTIASRSYCRPAVDRPDVFF
jgi:hypothetical protein